jgi:hypothetical protein
MAISRRKTLSLIGGGTILAASGAATGFALSRRPGTALRPWEMAGSYSDPRKRALSYAILAPNPHNRQPWLVDLPGGDTVIVYRDHAKNLPHTDPFERQLTIGMGCFLEQLEIAASRDGYRVETTLFPEGEAGPVAVLRFQKGGVPDGLFEQIPSRRSTKEAYEDRPVGADALRALAPFARIIHDLPLVKTLRRLTKEALAVEMLTPRTMGESIDLMRFGKAEIERNPDGIAISGAFLEGLMLAGMLNRESMADPDNQVAQSGMEMLLDKLEATPAYAVISTSGNGREDQIAAGRRWLRLNLTATAHGLSLHPVSQALQEYPEMAAHYQRAHKLLAKPGETVQMLGRLGYGPKAGRTPRWPLEARMRNG